MDPTLFLPITRQSTPGLRRSRSPAIKEGSQENLGYLLTIYAAPDGKSV